jgi:hypothetical protein
LRAASIAGTIIEAGIRMRAVAEHDVEQDHRRSADRRPP